MPNPFDYGGPVAGEHFTGRRRELAALTSRLRDHIGVVITAPRRYGKSSLIEQACAELSQSRPHPAIVKVNLLQAGSLPAAAGIVVRALYRVPGGPWHGLKGTVANFARRLRVSPRVTFDETGQPTFAFSSSLAAEDAEAVFADAYAILADIGAKRPAVLVLDEFQAVNDLSPHLGRHLKALADTHRQVALVVAGSRQHLMESLVLSQGAPLYDMLQPLALGPIELEDWVPFLVARAHGGGRPFVSEQVAEDVWARSRPVPFDVQQLAYECFAQATGRIERSTVEAAMGELIRHEANTYAQTFERISPGQRRVLQALAGGKGGSPGSSAFAVVAGLADSTSVRKALQTLTEREIVVRRPVGGWSIADPFFSAWIRREGGLT